MSSIYTAEHKKAVADLMFAFGDVNSPRPDTVECMCGLVDIFLAKVLRDTQDVSRMKGGFDADCLLFSVGDDVSTFKVAKTQLKRKRALDEELCVEF